ncbi:MAG: NADH:flavin oxidoreductase [Bacillota bacterium]
MNLLSSIKVNKLEVPNRIVLPPMETKKATSSGEVTEELLLHYKNREGVGLTIVEHTYIELRGRVKRKQLGIHEDDNIEGLKRLVDVHHKEGRLVGIQLNHGGSKVPKPMLKDLNVKAAAPSAILHPAVEDGEKPKELTREEMELIKDKFVKAALRAKEAGFDLVEIHGAHGYLLNQFTSPLTNKRSDEYGGSLENRLKFPIEVVSSVREALGSSFPLAYRLGCDDLLYGGIVPQTAAVIAVKLEDNGVDLLDLSGGLMGYDKADSGEGFFVYLGEIIKPAVKIPVIVTGGIKDPHYADELIKREKADLVGIGRAMYKNKNWAKDALKIIKNN